MLYHRKAAVVLTAVLAAALLFALPAMAGGAITDVSRLGCVISVTYTAHDMGSYNLEIYDNGAMIASYPTNAIGGTTVVAQHVITAPLADSSVGLTLILKGSWGEILDGFNGFVFSNEVAHRCAETGGSDSGESVAVEQPVSLPCPIPSGSVVGDMPFATSVYWAPGKLTAPVATLNPGTYWVVGTDATGEYYQLYLSCQLVWVPVVSMQPTFQSPWNGQALPTRAVE